MKPFVSVDVYHQTFIWPSDDSIAQRLEKGQGLSEKQRLAELKRYRCEVTGLTSAYKHVLKIVNGDQPHEDVYQQGTDTETAKRKMNKCDDLEEKCCDSDVI